MRELTVLRRARPGVPVATDDEVARSRARLLELIEAEETSGLPSADGPTGTSPTPPGSTVVDLALEPDAETVAPPQDRSRSRAARFLLAAALLLGAMWVADVVIDPGPDVPVIGPVDVPTPAPAEPAELGHHATESRTLTLWVGQGVPATVVSPVSAGPWPQVVLLPHEFARNEWDTFPQLHVEAMQPVAELLASTGATVITLGAVEQRGSIEAFDRAGENIRCAVAVARSGELGDPARVVIFAQGQSGYEAIVAIAREDPVRAGCRARDRVLPDLVVAASGVYDLRSPWFLAEWPGDEASIEERRLPSVLSHDTGVPIVFAEPPIPDALDLVGDTLRLGELLETTGFDASLIEVDGLSRTAWATEHEPTRRLVELVSLSAYAPDSVRGRSVPPPLIDEPPQRDGFPLY